MQYPVITSKAAQDQLGKIRSDHVDTLRGLQDQSMRVDQFRKEQAMQQQQGNAFMQDMQNNQEQNRMKQQEIDIKRISSMSI